MADKIVKPKRKMPMDKIADRMSRADSLASVSEFGRIIPPSQQAAERKKRKPAGNIFEQIGRALRGGQ